MMVRLMRGRMVGAAVCAVLLAGLLGSCASGEPQGAGSAGASGSGARDVAATFADQVIHESEITDYTESFRRDNGLEDDLGWASYLSGSGLTAESWREDVIRQKADHALVEARAAELGIAVDEREVEERIETVRKEQGLVDDDAAWERFLEQNGQTPESLRESYGFVSLEQQLLETDSGLTDELRSEMCDDYLKTNLADQVVRHYVAREFPLDDEADARACVEELAALDADALAQRFSQEAIDAGDAVDLGWDFLYREATIDPDLDLRGAMLAAGEMLGRPLAGTDAYRVVYCVERASFDGVISYDAIESASLKSLIADLTLSSQWAARISQYLSGLEEEADVQVVPMPEGLPYDVVDSKEEEQ